MKYDMASISVMLAMPTHRDLPPETVGSLLDTQQMCFEQGIPLQVYFGKGSSLVHHARSKIAWQFLQTPFTRLFWVDSDMSWSPKAFFRLLTLSTVKEATAAAYPPRHATGDWFIRFDAETVEADEHGCLAARDLGLGFACLQRGLVEQLAEAAPKARFPDVNEGKPIPHIFRMEVKDEMAVGEDVAFWADVRALGYRVNVDPTITLGHIGQKVFTGSLIEHLTPTEARNGASDPA